VKHLLLCVACLIAAASVPARAADTPSGWQQTTAHELGERCHSADAAKHAACIGYVSAIYDLQFAQTPVRGVCPPANLNPDNLTAVVVAYIDTHDDGPAPAAIAQSIVRFFPCQTASESTRQEAPRR